MTPEIRKDRPYVTVAADGSGQFRTISEGIKYLQNGTVIQVRSGVYRENLEISSDVEIVGEGDRSLIILEAESDQPAVSLLSGRLKLENMTIKASIQQRSCVFLNGGTSVLNDCDLSGGGLEIVRVNNCYVEIARCHIHHGTTEGMTFRGRSSGIIESCDFYYNHGDGFYSEASANPTLLHCKLYANRNAGASCFGESMVIFEDCEMRENVIGIYTSQESRPTLRRVQLYDNLRGGALFVGDSSPALENCEIYRNALHGVSCGEKSKPVLRHCIIHHNQLNGVNCSGESKAILEGCEMRENILYGFCCYETSSPILRGCSIQRNKDAGFVCLGESKAFLEGCIITENLKSNYLKDKTANPTLVKCIVG